MSKASEPKNSVFDEVTLYMAVSEDRTEPWVVERKRSVCENDQRVVTRYDTLPIFPEEADLWIGLIQSAKERWQTQLSDQTAEQSGRGKDIVVCGDHPLFRQDEFVAHCATYRDH